ncbi:hypothetical protein ACLKA6_008357 [Drosophila palustris]
MDICGTLGRLPLLKELHTNCTSNKHISRLPNLTKLILNILGNENTLLKNWLVDHKSKQLDHLEIHTLHYRNCSNAEILVDIGKLYLPNNDVITDPALEALFTFPDLQEINVPDNGALRLILACPKLRVLHLEECFLLNYN